MPSTDLCLFHYLTGLPCAGCGLTRSICAISHGMFAQALTYNPFGYVFYAGLLWVLVWPAAARSVTPARLIASRRFQYGLLALALLMLSFNLWRIMTMGDRHQ
jgi:hypothetical protein